MSLRSRSQRAAVKKVDYVEWSSGDEEEEEEDQHYADYAASQSQGSADEEGKEDQAREDGEGEEEEDGVWTLRLVVTDDEERRYELVGEALDSPLPPLIKPPKPAATNANLDSSAAEEDKKDAAGGTQESQEGEAREVEKKEAGEQGAEPKVEEKTAAPAPSLRRPKKAGASKQSFYAAMKALEGGQNVGLLEGWWFCLRASGAEDPKAIPASNSSTSLGTASSSSSSSSSSSTSTSSSSSAQHPYIQPLMLSAGRKKLARFPTEGLLSCYLTYGPTNARKKVSYALQDISYDVQQSFFNMNSDKKRQKTGKTYHVDRSSSPTCETDQLVLRIENGKLMAVRLFVEFKDLPATWKRKARAEERYRETHSVLFLKRENSKRVQFDDNRVSVRLYLCDDPPTQHLAEEKTQILAEEEMGKRKLKEKGEGAILKTVLKTKVHDDEDEDKPAENGTTTTSQTTPIDGQSGAVLSLSMDPILDEQELLKKTVLELRAMLKERKLPVTGNKETLMSRLTGKPPPVSSKKTVATDANGAGQATPSNKRKRKAKSDEAQGEQDAADEGNKKKKTKKGSKPKEKPALDIRDLNLLTKESLSSKSRDTLRQLATRLQVPQHGTKEDVISRLLQLAPQAQANGGKPATAASEEHAKVIEMSSNKDDQAEDKKDGKKRKHEGKPEKNEKRPKEENVDQVIILQDEEEDEGELSGETFDADSPPPPPAQAADTKLAELQKMTVVALRQLCKDKDIKRGGSKDEIVERLYQFLYPKPGSTAVGSTSTSSSSSSPRKRKGSTENGKASGGRKRSKADKAKEEKDEKEQEAQDEKSDEETQPIRKTSPPATRPKRLPPKKQGATEDSEPDKTVERRRSSWPPTTPTAATSPASTARSTASASAVSKALVVSPRPAATAESRPSVNTSTPKIPGGGARRVGLSRSRPSKPLHPSVKKGAADNRSEK